MTGNDFEYKIKKSDPLLSHVVERFWMLANHSDKEKEIVIVPDGRVDLFFSYSDTEPYHIALMGLESKPTQTVPGSGTEWAPPPRSCLRAGPPGRAAGRARGIRAGPPKPPRPPRPASEAGSGVCRRAR